MQRNPIRCQSLVHLLYGDVWHKHSLSPWSKRQHPGETGNLQLSGTKLKLKLYSLLPSYNQALLVCLLNDVLNELRDRCHAFNWGEKGEIGTSYE